MAEDSERLKRKKIATIFEEELRDQNFLHEPVDEGNRILTQEHGTSVWKNNLELVSACSSWLQSITHILSNCSIFDDEEWYRDKLSFEEILAKLQKIQSSSNNVRYSPYVFQKLVLSAGALRIFPESDIQQQTLDACKVIESAILLVSLITEALLYKHLVLSDSVFVAVFERLLVRPEYPPASLESLVMFREMLLCLEHLLCFNAFRKKHFSSSNFLNFFEQPDVYYQRMKEELKRLSLNDSRSALSPFGSEGKPNAYRGRAVKWERYVYGHVALECVYEFPTRITWNTAKAKKAESDVLAQIEKLAENNRMVHISDIGKSFTFRSRATINPKGFSREEMHLLYGKAINFVSGKGPLAEVVFMYRCKPQHYFDEQQTFFGGTMKKYYKDSGNHEESPINNVLQGLFFSAHLRGCGTKVTVSPFGDLCFRLIDTDILDFRHFNFYFSDFYCFPSETLHYITIVICRKESAADSFCASRLVLLDPEWNPFMVNMIDNGYMKHFLRKSKDYKCEFFFTEDISLKAGEIRSIAPMFRGSSHPRGKKGDKACELCNLVVVQGIKSFAGPQYQMKGAVDEALKVCAEIASAAKGKENCGVNDFLLLAKGFDVLVEVYNGVLCHITSMGKKTVVEIDEEKRLFEETFVTIEDLELRLSAVLFKWISEFLSKTSAVAMLRRNLPSEFRGA